MKNKMRSKSRTAKTERRLTLVTITVVAVIVAIAAITVVAKQLSTPKSSAANSPTQAERQYVTVKVAGHDVQLDPQTGQIKPMTAEKAQEIAADLKVRLNKSTDGLVQVQNRDGSVSMDLQGRAQNVVLARTNEDGTVENACVDEPLAAAEFLGIDPHLLGVEPPKRADSPGTITRTPPKKVNQ